MRRIMLLVTAAGRILAEDGAPLIGSRYAKLLVLCAMGAAMMAAGLLAFASPARADVVCSSDQAFCWEKTATPDPVKVGEPLTFTIRAFCTSPGGGGCGLSSPQGLTDTLPAGVEFVSASATGYLPATCSEIAGTVRCDPLSFFKASDGTEVPFVATIEVIPTQCGTFTNTATAPGFSDYLPPVSETFTVEGCVPTTKAQCKKGGWRDYGYPDQGTCISAVTQNRR